MADSTADLNARLPLLDPAALTPDQQEVYDRLAGKWLPWAKESGFAAQTGDGRLLGPFNALVVSPEMGAAMLNYLGTERDATDLDAVVREVVILTVGAATRCEYELYAHRAVALKAGLPAEAVDALVRGEEPAGMDASAVQAHRFVRALVAEHRVPDEVYAETLTLFSHKCLVDMVHLAGLYLGTAAILNAFQVPVPQG